ncbi:MAG: radical SAM protein [Candidatus Bathyarchaeia archaeon]
MPQSLSEMMDAARRASLKNLGGRIFFYAPSFSHNPCAKAGGDAYAFPSISVTGEKCALQCRHCGGRLLKTMIPAETPPRLAEVGRMVKERGAVGCLISGGCPPDGSVPLRRFLPAIRAMKERLRLKIVLHTGLVSREDAYAIADARVDLVSMDVVGSDETAREIYRLKAGVRGFERSLEALNEVGVPVSPHVLIGLDRGRLKGEFDAIDMISRYRVSSLIYIVLTPFRGTEMERVEPPQPRDVAKVFCHGRLRLPSVFQSLGCMRPSRVHRVETDTLAVRAGINGIAYPAQEAISLAERSGLETVFVPWCCSFADRIFDDTAALQAKAKGSKRASRWS